jgi:amidase
MPVTGPLAQSPRDLRLFLETVIQAKPWNYDCDALAIPWRSIRCDRPLNIGVINECPDVPVYPPIMRALEEATDKLSHGHKIIPLKSLPSFAKATELAFNMFDIDNEKTSLRFITDSGEPLVTSVQAVMNMYPPPKSGRKDKTLTELYGMNVQRHGYRAKWLKIFRENDLDVIIAPAARHTAVPHDSYEAPA